MKAALFRDNLQWSILVRYYNREITSVKPLAASGNLARAKIFEGDYKYNCYATPVDRLPDTLTYTGYR
jgi:hypothetical protein